MLETSLQQNLSINVLGALSVCDQERSVELPRSRKTRALLAFLALSERPVRRERLCEIFWEIPDDPKAALRWSLSKIRGVVNADDANRLIADRTSVSFDQSQISVDWRELKNSAAGGFDKLETARLEELAAMLGGGFLEELSLQHCPEYEAWRMAEAAKVEITATELLMTLLQRLDADPDKALPYAVRLRTFASDPEQVDQLIAKLRAGTFRAQPAKAAEPIEAPTVSFAAAPASQVKFCLASDGSRLAWCATGTGPPILRGPHWMTHLEFDEQTPIWRHWIEEFSQENTFVRFDQRCNGLSDRAVEDISFERMVEDIGDVADDAGLNEFVLLGISQSCAYSVAYAVRHPERVRGLILYGGFVKGWRLRGDQFEIERRDAMRVLIRQGWGTDSPTFRQLFTTMFLPKATQEQAGWYNELQRRAATPADAERLAEASGVIDVEHLLSAVRVPTVVVHATGDQVAPIEWSRRFADGIPGAEFIEIESSNHILMGDEPAFQQLVNASREFCKRVFEEPRATQAAAPRAAVPQQELPPKTTETRRQITALAADIVTPMQAFETLDAEVALSAVRPLLATARRVIESNFGEVLVASDVGFVAVFGAREASEVHAVRAAKAALELQVEIRRASSESARVRIALDSGEAIVTTDAGGGLSVSGPMLRFTRRMADTLRRPLVAASDRYKNLAGGYVQSSPLKSDEHPGLGGNQSTHEVLALNTALSRWYLRTPGTLSPFVGREPECQMLGHLWQHVGEGRGQVALLVAEPGVGKSRLSHEFLNVMAGQDSRLVEAGAFEFDRDVPYIVIKRLLRSALAITDWDPAEDATEKLNRGLEQSGCDPSINAPLAFTLDLPVEDPDWETVPAEDRAQRISDGVRQLVARLAGRIPVLILVEDLHWIDLESRKVLERLVDSIDRQRAMLLLTSRPEFKHDWMSRSAVHVLRLHPLNSDDSKILVRSLIGRHPSVADLCRLLVKRTDGSPLMIEETVRALIEAGRIQGEAGAYTAPQPIVDIETASSVQPVIAARIERLPSRERGLLQMAAVIGRNVDRTLLRSLSGLDGREFDTTVSALERGEFLFEVMSSSAREFTFKHALIHDAAYGSLMRKDRRRLHAAIFEAIERIYSGKLVDQTEALAEHAYRARLFEPAAHWSARAGDRAIERSAYSAAMVCFERVLEMLDNLPETPERACLGIDVRSQLRVAYMVTGNYPTGVSRLKEASDLAERIGDVERRLQVQLHLSFLHSTFGRIEKAIRAAQKAGEIAREQGLLRYAAEADLAAAQGALFRSDARSALQYLSCYHEGFLTEWRYDRFGFLVTRSVWYLGSLAYAHALLGDFRAAAREIDEAATVAEETRRPIDIYATHFFRNNIDGIRGPSSEDLDRMKVAAHDCLNRAPFPFSPMLLTSLGYAQIRARQFAGARRSLGQALEAAQTIQMLHYVNLARSMLAWLRAIEGEQGARDELHWADRWAQKNGDNWLRVRVLAALAEIESDESEQLRQLTLAADLAKESGYLPLQARMLAAIGQRLRGRDDSRSKSLTEKATRLLVKMGLRDEAAALRRGDAFDRRV